MCARLWVKKPHRGGKVDGYKTVFFFMFLIFHVGDLGWFCVVKTSFVHDAGWLARARLVPAMRCHGY
jgi:hypothetical protein